MPAKKKTRPSQRKSKTSAASKSPIKKASKKRLAVKTKAPKKLAKKKEAQRTAVATTNAKRKKTTTVKTARDIEEQIQDQNRAVDAMGSSRARQGRVFGPAIGRFAGDVSCGGG